MRGVITLNGQVMVPWMLPASKTWPYHARFISLSRWSKFSRMFRLGFGFQTVPSVDSGLLALRVQPGRTFICNTHSGDGCLMAIFRLVVIGSLSSKWLQEKLAKSREQAAEAAGQAALEAWWGGVGSCWSMGDQKSHGGWNEVQPFKIIPASDPKQCVGGHQQKILYVSLPIRAAATNRRKIVYQTFVCVFCTLRISRSSAGVMSPIHVVPSTNMDPL